MHRSNPKVFVIAETKQSSAGSLAYLREIGAITNMLNPPPDDFTTDAKSGGEWLIEVAGRSCYRSFKPQLNKNVKRVREGNKEYIGNILNQKHGSVLEHASVTFACTDVSRIFTHELVRHRAGVAISQESGRYVRIDDIGIFKPTCFTAEWLEQNVVPFANRDTAQTDSPQEHANYLSQTILSDIASKVVSDERFIEDWSAKFDLDHPKMPFHVKKELTSALRRFVAGGLATSIIFTANHRAIRHMIAMRTAEGAEEEIRIVFHMIAMQMQKMYTALYQDMSFEPVEGSDVPVAVFKNEKV